MYLLARSEGEKMKFLDSIVPKNGGRQNGAAAAAKRREREAQYAKAELEARKGSAIGDVYDLDGATEPALLFSSQSKQRNRS